MYRPEVCLWLSHVSVFHGAYTWSRFSSFYLYDALKWIAPSMRPIDIGCGFYTSVAIFASAIVADCFTCPEILTVDDCPDAGAKEQDTSHRNALCLSAVWKVAAPGKRRNKNIIDVDQY